MNYTKPVSMEDTEEAMSMKKDAMLANPDKKRGKQIMKAKFKASKEVYPIYADERHKFRAQILSMSLFPNVFNHEMVHTNLGAS